MRRRANERGGERICNATKERKRGMEEKIGSAGGNESRGKDGAVCASLLSLWEETHLEADKGSG